MRKGQTKTPQKQEIYEAQGRDLFQTPNYATDLIVPFLKREGIRSIWEPAAGLGKMVRRLEHHGFRVTATDIAYEDSFNFLTNGMSWFSGDAIQAIVTNTPFSLQKKFFKRCLEYKIPFALLIPAVYSGWIIEACKMGAEKIIPERRIDYITPNVLQRIHEGEIWENSSEFYPTVKEKGLKEFKKNFPKIWAGELEKYSGFCNWDSIYEVPLPLLRKYSSSDFHSMWLTMGLNLHQQETFVDLSNEDKDNI